MTAAHPSLSVVSSVHAWDATPITIEHVNESTDVIRLFSPTRDGLAVYGGQRFMRRLRDRLSVALGDDGSARIAGAYQGSIVLVDDHGQHLVSDDLVELTSCRLCVAQPATTTNDQGEAVCLGHA